jgi:hypothetical protein
LSSDPKDAGGRYEVIVADNFHYMDANEHTRHGSFSTYREAVAACEQIVEDCLDHLYKEGMAVEDLYEQYTGFGEDPFITGLGKDEPMFSAWTYAKEQCVRICRGKYRGA